MFNKSVMKKHRKWRTSKEWNKRNLKIE